MIDKEDLKRRLPMVALALGAASAPPIFALTQTAEAATREVYVAAAMQQNADERTYAEWWTLANYGAPPGGYNSDCNNDGVVGDPEFAGYGGWWHCDSGKDQKLNRYFGLDLHQLNASGGIITPDHPVWFRAYHHGSAVAPTAYAVIRHRDGCDESVTIEIYYGTMTLSNMFMELQYLHIMNRPDETQFNLTAPFTQYSLGQVDSSTTNCYPPHLHQAGSGPAHNAYTTTECYNADADKSNIERCYYDLAWTGDPPSNYLFYGYYGASDPPGGSGGGGGGGACWTPAGIQKC